MATAHDFYKLAHQGVMGSEHAIRSEADARLWLQREIASLKRLPNGTDEALIEPLPPDGRYVRVHLRPFVARGFATEALLKAFIATANASRTDSTLLICATTTLPEAVARVFLAQRAAGFSAVHHSTEYEQAYSPAYRVISAAYARSFR